MTPGARVAAAIEILDLWRAGQPVEQALTRWARRSRFAGSKDRAAVRDHVYDVLRAADTARAFAGGETGRALMIGLLRARAEDLGTLFDGQGHAPAPLSETERGFVPTQESAEIWNLPNWLIEAFQSSLGAHAKEAAVLLQERAPVSVRVNSARTTREAARALLAQDNITAIENPLADTALTLTHGARRLRNARAYLEGFVEIQDAASQAVVAAVPTGRKCLDYCAGGGGKALALAAQHDREVFAHDRNPARMKDIPPRAARADCRVETIDTGGLAQAAPFDLVLCDAPCSGSGAWRRSPEAKWTFTPQALETLVEVQHDILLRAADLTAVSGTLVYATCSVLKAENEEAIARFLDIHRNWKCSFEKRININTEGDGFYTAHLTRENI